MAIADDGSRSFHSLKRAGQCDPPSVPKMPNVRLRAVDKQTTTEVVKGLLVRCPSKTPVSWRSIHSETAPRLNVLAPRIRGRGAKFGLFSILGCRRVPGAGFGRRPRRLQSGAFIDVHAPGSAAWTPGQNHSRNNTTLSAKTSFLFFSLSLSFPFEYFATYMTLSRAFCSVKHWDRATAFIRFPGMVHVCE